MYFKVQILNFGVLCKYWQENDHITGDKPILFPGVKSTILLN